MATAATLAPEPTTEIASPTEPAPAPPTAPGPADPFFRISLDLYNRMIELELLGPRDRIVLLDGFLVKKMPKGYRHVGSTRRSYNALLARATAAWHPRFEAPIGLALGPDGDSSPEPDVVIVRGDDEIYMRRHPDARDVLLIVEVADSSLAADRRALRRYAWAGIPAVWIVNLRNRTVEVYTGPSGPVEDPGYAEKVTRGQEETVAFRLDDGTSVELRAADLLA